MTAMLISDRNRPAHLGPYPTKRLARGGSPDLDRFRPAEPLQFRHPEESDYENHSFTLRLLDGREYLIPAADVFAENGIHVDEKCSDRLCGACKCRLISGEVEHRGLVLSRKQREDTIILCPSRAASSGRVIEVDLKA